VHSLVSANSANFDGKLAEILHTFNDQRSNKKELSFTASTKIF